MTSCHASQNRAVISSRKCSEDSRSESIYEGANITPRVVAEEQLTEQPYLVSSQCSQDSSKVEKVESAVQSEASAGSPVGESATLSNTDIQAANTCVDEPGCTIEHGEAGSSRTADEAACPTQAVYAEASKHQEAGASSVVDAEASPTQVISVEASEHAEAHPVAAPDEAASLSQTTVKESSSSSGQALELEADATLAHAAVLSERIPRTSPGPIPIVTFTMREAVESNLDCWPTPVTVRSRTPSGDEESSYISLY